MVSTYYFVLFIFFIKGSVSSYLSCSRENLTIEEAGKDRRLTATPYLTVTVANENKCLGVCIYDDYCLSYNVDMAGVSIKCELFSRLDGQQMLESQISFKYFKVHSDHRCIPVENSSPKICDCRSVPHAKKDCLEWRENGALEDGLYKIKVNDQIFEVFCDMKTDGGGWTMIQNRFRSNNTIRFNRTWDEYKHGFGDLTTEFWLGNDYIHNLSTQGEITLRIHSTAENNMKKVSILTHFRVSGEHKFYQVTYQSMSGPSLNGVDTEFNQSDFSTFDLDRDSKLNINCAERFNTGFWLDGCPMANLNGPYAAGFGFIWKNWNAPEDLQIYQLKSSSMMIRRKVN
ncbi:fibrinogen-like protein 1 [Hydractinia symbiolongicarpus]|uniref:fibrinogen-like protein 1 n=1 Tax=Hydractinia symbiolongicarpus TaxID=13093 RepID=UPI00254FB129|nr:fibrinogen-like protein 1 [Hydractinia symbiolongicarpus]